MGWNFRADVSCLCTSTVGMRRRAPVVSLLTALLRCYGAPAVDMRCRCVFRQDDICTVSEIIFLQELDPGVCGLKCTWTLLMYVGLRVEVQVNVMRWEQRGGTAE